MLMLGNRQPARAASNSRALRARIMAIAPWMVSRSVSQIGMRFSATSPSPGWAKQNAVATGPRCVSRTAYSIGLPSLYLDGLAMHGHRPPLAVETVLIGLRRIGFELKQVGLIGAQGRDAPGHVLA